MKRKNITTNFAFLLSLFLVGHLHSFGQGDKISILSMGNTTEPPRFDIYGIPHTQCTFNNNYGKTITFSLDETGHHTAPYIQTKYGHNQWSLSAPAGSITGLTFTYNVVSLSINSCVNLDSLCIRDNTYGWGNESILNDLNLSGCPNLRKLVCPSQPELTDLNVTKCKKLQYIDCRRCPLDSLDVSGLTELKKLYIPNYRGGEPICALRKLNASGCTSLDSLDVSGALYEGCRGALQSLNISGCTNLQFLDCRYNPLKYLDASNLKKLKKLYASYGATGPWPDYEIFSLVDLNVSGCTALEQLYCTSYSNGKLSNINIDGCTSLNSLWCSNNLLTNLDVSSCTNLKILMCDHNLLTNLDVSSCTNLQTLHCQGNPFTKVNANNLKNLKHLSITEHKATKELSFLHDLNISGCAALDSLYCPDLKLTKIDLSGCTNLQFLDCQNNRLDSLNLSNLENLRVLYANNNSLKKLTIHGCMNLQTLDCSYNSIKSLDLSNFTNLKKLFCGRDSLKSLNVSGCTALIELDCEGTYKTMSGNYQNTIWDIYGKISSLKVTGCINLKSLRCRYNVLDSLDASNLTSLKELYIPNGAGYHSLKSLNISGCTALTELDCSGYYSPYHHRSIGGLLGNLNASGCRNLQSLICNENKLKYLNIKNCNNLDTLYCAFNQLTSLDVSNCHKLQTLNCNNNQLTSLDVSNCDSLHSLYCRNNLLKNLNINKISTKLVADSNSLSLSECHAISRKFTMYEDFYSLSPQNIYLYLSLDDTLNLGKEMLLEYTTTLSTSAEENKDYILKDSNLIFKKNGLFSFTLRNDRVWERYIKEYYYGTPCVDRRRVAVTYHITVPERITQPVFLPKQSTLLEDETITISCSADSAKIYYTLDGSKPTPTSFLYTEPFSLQPNTTTTIKAIATKEGFSDSQIAMATYTVKPKQNEPDNDTVSNLSHTHRFTLPLYPNPCHDVIYMTTDEPNATMDIHMLRILDLQGHERKRIMGNIHAIDISQLPAGIYVLEAVYKNGHIDRHKIIKQ